MGDFVTGPALMERGPSTAAREPFTGRRVFRLAFAQDDKILLDRGVVMAGERPEVDGLLDSRWDTKGLVSLPYENGGGHGWLAGGSD